MAEDHERRNNPPTDHDSRDPETSPEAMKEDVARHLKKEITEKKDTCSRGEDGIGEPRFVMHGEFGEADIDAVEIGQHVAEKKEGDEAERYFAVGGRIGERDWGVGTGHLLRMAHESRPRGDCSLGLGLTSWFLQLG